MTDFGKEFVKTVFNSFGQKTNRQSIRSGNKSVVIDGDNVIINGKKIGLEDEHFIPKRESKPKFKSREEYDAHLSELKVIAQEKVVANILKLKALKSVTSEQLDKKFEEFCMDDYIASIFQQKVASFIERKAYMVVDEALEDLEEDGRVTRGIRNSVINKIIKAFK